MILKPCLSHFLPKFEIPGNVFNNSRRVKGKRIHKQARLGDHRSTERKVFVTVFVYSDFTLHLRKSEEIISRQEYLGIKRSFHGACKLGGLPTYPPRCHRGDLCASLLWWRAVR